MTDKGPPPLLLTDFTPQSKDDWIAAIEKDLGGADYRKKLVWKTYDGLEIDPLYTPEDLEGLGHLDAPPGEPPYVRGTATGNDWAIIAEIATPRIEEAARQAREGLSRGLDGISIVCELTGSGISGVPIETQAHMEALLRDIDLEAVPLRLVCGVTPLPALAMVVNEARRRGTPLAGIRLTLEADPLATLATEGSLPRSRFDTFNDLKTALLFMEANMPASRALCVHSHHFHDGGASPALELGMTLAAGAEYISGLTSMDMTVDQVARHMAFSFSIGSSYFIEIARLRAARMLWAAIVERFDPRDARSAKMAVHARVSSWSQTVYDPHVNMLRATTEAMSAAIAGADSITVLPFDLPYETPDDFAHRVARNTQLVLKHEAYLDKVTDPAAGSYYIESLTDQLARSALGVFKEIESRGGLIESLLSGYIQGEIARTRSEREASIATRKDSLLGTNQFPNTGEEMAGKIEETVPVKPVERRGRAFDTFEDIAAEAKKDGASIADLLAPGPPEPELTVEPLPRCRASAQFDALRLATERYAERTGHRPRVFLLTTGDLATRMARASFSLNLFGCAGFAVIDNPGFATAAEGAGAALESGAEMVVICSSDDEYPGIAPEICSMLKGENPGIKVIVAGYPRDSVRQLEDAGVDDFIHARTNAVEILKKYQHLLGIDRPGRAER